MTGFAGAKKTFDNLERPIGGYSAGLIQQQDTADFALDARWSRDFSFQYSK
jgi:hypothetical protein